jgi:hypothetical protein
MSWSKGDRQLLIGRLLDEVIWPEASRVQNNMAAVSAEGGTVCVLIRRLNSSCNMQSL